MRIIDAFAGVGGIRKGFEQSAFNIQCVQTIEFDKFALQTYNANFAGEVEPIDIREVTTLPDHDIFCAGFPCQPFSQAGAGQGFSDTRGTAFFDIVRLLAVAQPSVVFLENVAGLLHHDKGNTMSVIVDSLKRIGYTNLHYTKLKARDFGLPQIRERVYIVGFLDNAVTFTFPTPQCLPTKVGDVLETNVDSKYTLSDISWAGLQSAKIRNNRNGKGFGYSLFTHDSPYTNTILRQYYKDGKSVLIDQGEQNPRKLTPRECARLQGFEDSFAIPVSNTQAYKQFGNSVAIPVVRQIASRIIQAVGHE